MAVIVCPICSTRYRVVDSQLSQASRLKCKKCKTVFPVSDNIKTDDPSKGDGTAEILPPPKGESTPPPQVGSKKPQEDVPQGFNLGDLGLDFGTSAKSAVPELDFSFGASVPKDEETAEEEQLHDHIANASQEDQGRIEVGLGDLALEKSGASEETVSMDHSLDFSFSASIPEAPPEEEGEVTISEESMGFAEGSGQTASLEGLNFGEGLSEATVTLPGGPALKPSRVGQDLPPQEVIAEPPKDEGISQEPLSTCCIDSLAMGLSKCEICGRNLKGREREVGDELKQLRKQQLKDELLQGEVQVGFSDEPLGDDVGMVPKTDEDFTDVERALDALADGTFEKEIKKKEVQKAAAKRMKMLALGVGLIIVLGGAVIWSLLPSSHEKLVARYEKLMSQQEMDPREVTNLFLDAVSEHDQDIFNRLAVMPEMPELTSGKIVAVGEEYEQISIGSPGKDIAALKEELAKLNGTYQEKEKKWQEESSLDLSPKLLEDAINTLTKKQEALQAEFKGKEADSAKKLVSLQQERDAAKQDLEENRKRAQEYIDAPDQTGKAIYTASVRKIQSLEEKIGKLETQIREEDTAHRQRMDALKAEYNPRLASLKEELQKQQVLFEKAKLLQDQKNSPLLLLDKELKDLKKLINEKETALKDKEKQLQTAVAFFKRDDQKQLVEKNRDRAEFVHVSKNVKAAVKFQGGAKQEVPIVLKRYQANIGDQTIQGDWVVEKILQP